MRRAAIGTAGLLALWLLSAAASEQRDVGGWKPAGRLLTGRYAPAAVRLPDGRALVAGGFSFETGRTHASSDVFDPAAGTWSEGPVMRLDRNFPVAIPLPGGDCLFVAGFRVRGGTTATTEHLVGAGPRFRAEAPQPALEERELFSATALRDGRWLLAGGFSTLRRKTLDSAEIFDPATGKFVLTGRMRQARFGHAGVLLADGKVLLVGGKILATDRSVLEAEIYDPATGSFTQAAALSAGRDRCTAWLSPGLPGRSPDSVLVAGGSAHDGGTVPGKRCEVYDPTTGSFHPGPELVRDRMAHTATPLADGSVLLVGGWSTSENRTTTQAELWLPGERRFVPAGRLEHGRHDHVAVLLKDGRVLVAGGKEAPARQGVETPLAGEVWSR